MNIAVIFAGGVGSRMRESEIPKQFLVLHGRPIIVRTLQQFEGTDVIDAIVVVSNREWLDYTDGLIRQYQISKVRRVVPGGRTGQESIYNGLLCAKDIAGDVPSVALIHDGVRPIVEATGIRKCVDSVHRFGSAVTAVACTETVAVSRPDGTVGSVLDRNQIQLLRAPQCFWLDEVLAAHQKALAAGRLDYVDSATLMVDAGACLHLVSGSPKNIKVTTQSDFHAIQAILTAEENTQFDHDSE